MGNVPQGEPHLQGPVMPVPEGTKPRLLARTRGRCYLFRVAVRSLRRQRKQALVHNWLSSTRVREARFGLTVFLLVVGMSACIDGASVQAPLSEEFVDILEQQRLLPPPPPPVEDVDLDAADGDVELDVPDGGPPPGACEEGGNLSVEEFRKCRRATGNALDAGLAAQLCAFSRSAPAYAGVAASVGVKCPE